MEEGVKKMRSECEASTSTVYPSDALAADFSLSYKRTNIKY